MSGLRLFVVCTLLLVVPPICLVLYNAEALGLVAQPDPEAAAKGAAAQKQGTIYFFTADWCAYCRSMQPTVKELRAEGVRIKSIDVDYQDEMVVRYGVHKVPTFIHVVGRKEVGRVTGTASKGELLNLWNRGFSIMSLFE